MTSPALVEIGSMALGQRGNLRSAPTNSLAYSGALAAGQGAKGYSGLDNARKLLNDMIYEAELKYEEEIHQCTEFYSVKCAALQAGQSDLLASNFLAASSRTLMASATTTSKRCEDELEKTEKELDDHLEECHKQRMALTTRLEIVLGDIEVLTTILQMTDCKSGKALLQLRRCQNECTKESTIEFA